MKKWLMMSSALFAAMGFVAVPSVASASAVSVSHAPMVRAKLPTSGHGNGGHGSSTGSSSNYAWASSNWSGYALSTNTAGTYTDITGSWVVPTVQQSKGSTYSSTWIGIDGFNNSNLIQTGTEQDYSNGSTHYYAWWEILPAAETQITTTSNGGPATVKPGDTMSAHIQENNNGTWTITIDNTSEGWSFTTTQNYSGPGTSAEWIEEAPTIGGHVATLANYGQVKIDPGTVNGGNPVFNTGELGVMEQHNTIVSYPSLPDNDTDGFNAAYGATQPAAPLS